MNLFSQFRRFTRVYCNSSGKTTVNPYCKIRMISREKSFIVVRCDFNHLLTNFNVDGFAWFKSSTSQNFRQFVTIRKIDACSVFENAATVLGMDRLIMFFNHTFPGIIHKCPYANIDVKNASLDIKMGTWALSPFPNGVFKVTFHLYDDLDDNIVTLTYFSESFMRSLIFDGKAFME
jgi:hypothetical protein